MTVYCGIPLQSACYSSLEHLKIYIQSIKLTILFALCIAHSAYAGNNLRDDTGQVLQLKQTPQRIISLAPHVTELLFAVGAGQKIVGASEYSIILRRRGIFHASAGPYWTWKQLPPYARI